MLEARQSLLHLDEFDSNTIGAFDHSATRITPAMDVFDKRDVFFLQPTHGQRQVRSAQRPVVHDLSARADESAAGPRAYQNRDVFEIRAAGRLTHETCFPERRPRGRRVSSRATVAGRSRVRTSTLRYCRAEMFGVPLHRT